jgi:hypothetical protein
MGAHRINFTKTFAPVISFSPLRLLLSLCHYHQIHVHHLNIVIAFLHEDLRETIYIRSISAIEKKIVWVKTGAINMVRQAIDLSSLIKIYMLQI